MQSENNITWLTWANGEEWGEIACPMMDGKPVMTYYPQNAVAVYYTYSAPFVMDGEVFYYRFDHDEGMWDMEMFFMGEYFKGLVCNFAER